MIVSHKYKFIFIKNYKTAGSSIESYLHPYLGDDDIIAQTEDYLGKNNFGEFNDIHEIYGYLPQKSVEKKYRGQMRYYPHMPIWLIQKRLPERVFNEYFKFCVIRNPYDLLISAFHWENKNIQETNIKDKFLEFIYSIKNTELKDHGTYNMNNICSKDGDKVLTDKIINFDTLNHELSDVFKKLKIPFNGKLDIFKKKSTIKFNYDKYFNKEIINFVNEKYWREIEMFNYKLESNQF